MINIMQIIAMILLSVFFRDILRLRVNPSFLEQFSDIQRLRVENGCIDSYSSMTKFLTVYMVLFLAFLNYYSRQEDYIIIRLKKRSSIAINRSIIVLKVTLLIFIPHFVINLLYNVHYYSWSLLKETRYFYSEFVYMVMIILFFCTLGTFYMMLFDYLKRFKICGLIVAISFVFYLLNRFYFQNGLARFLIYRDIILDGQESIFEIMCWIIIFISLCAFNIMSTSKKVERMDLL